MTNSPAMFNVLETHIKIYANFSIEEIAAIRSVCLPMTIRKKQHLLQAGQISQHHSFVCKGCLRTYRVDDMGAEHILGFSTSNSWATEDLSLFQSMRSTSYIEAIEDTDIIQISGENFRKLTRELEGFKLLHQKLTIENTVRETERAYCLITQQAEGRYRDFNQNYPGLSLRLPIYMIASYLGISRETLSRIRSDIASTARS